MGDFIFSHINWINWYTPRNENRISCKFIETLRDGFSTNNLCRTVPNLKFQQQMYQENCNECHEYLSAVNWTEMENLDICES